MKEEQKERASPHLLRLNRFETTVRRMTVSVLVYWTLFVTCVADRTQILEEKKNIVGASLSELRQEYCATDE